MKSSIAAMPANTGAAAGGQVGKVAATSKAAPAMSPDDDYDAKADMRTLVEANKIKADKGRHGRAKAAAKAHLAHISKVVQGD